MDADVTVATMPAGWSPGVAPSGTVMVNGTITVSPAGTSTVGWTSNHPPESWGSWSEVRMSNLPMGVKMPSLVTIVNVTGPAPWFETAT
ncbi:hypothetical protein D3C74_342180 [compost metagenome]